MPWLGEGGESFPDEGEAHCELQAATQFWFSAAQSLLSGNKLKQTSCLLVQLLILFFMHASDVSSAIEILAKEKIKVNKTMTKHEIKENIPNCFIMSLSSI